MSKPESTVTPAPEFLTVSQLRTRWKVSAMFIWRMRRDGKLKAYKLGERGVRFLVADVAAIEASAAS